MLTTNLLRVLIGLLCINCLLVAGARSQTLSPRKVFGRYQQFVWLEEHGLPQNTVQAVTRASDGYLWLGTLAGAARFDGARFTVFDNGNTREIKGSYVTAFLEDRQGALWIGADGGGLIRYRDGRFSLLTTRDGLPNDTTKALLEDRAGALWGGTYGGLARFKDGRFTVYTTRDGLPGDLITSLAEDGSGALWVGSANGLARFKDGRFTVYTTRDGLSHNNVTALLFDRAGNLWIGVENGLCRFKDGRFTVHGAWDELRNVQVNAIARDREDNLWVGTLGGGLFRMAAQSMDARFARYASKDGLPGDRVVAIYQDPEGDIWVGTDGGLAQLRDGRFQVYGAAEGLAHDFAHGVYEDRAGNLWIGAANGLSRFKDGKFTNYGPRDGVPANAIFSIREDQTGALWFSAFGAGVVRFQNGRFTKLTAKDGLANDFIRAVLPDRAGNVWIGAYGGGLNLWRDGRVTLYTTRDGLASNYVRALFEDRAGAIWIGTQDGGVSRFKDGRFTNWTRKDGLANDFIVSFYEDSRGVLWLGSVDGGLTRFKDGKFVAITAKDGLYDNVAFQILSDTDDDSGNLWMSCNKGIYRVSLQELNDFADGRIRSVTSFAYGVSDGMLNRECNSGNPAGWKTRDGRLWFPSARGVVMIDPKRQNSQPPLLAIEKVTLDRVDLPLEQTVRIMLGQENLEIHYAGLSWGRPRQTRFKYRMAGLDQGWVDVGTRRTAYYPYLPPGEYTFTVTADNGEGVWNTKGKSLRIVVTPPFYRQWWSAALMAVSVLGLGMLWFRVRMRKLKQAKAAQEEFSRRLIESQERERQRIAAELHDGLSQSLVIIKNRALLSLSEPDNAARAFEQLEEIADSASQALDEVKNISYALRPYQLDRIGLRKALDSMVRKVAESSGLPITAEIGPIDGLFSQEGEINLYRIVQEGVNNIVRHSQATAARVTIKRHGQKVEVLIEDNGLGFIAGQSDGREPGKGGFGLIGMAERARIFGAHPVIRTAPGKGTTIIINIPLP